MSRPTTLDPRSRPAGNGCRRSRLPAGRAGAWLAVVGLALQILLGTAHSARHFDHLVGSPGRTHDVAFGDAAQSGPESPPGNGPVVPELDRCAIGLGLAAGGCGVLADPGRFCEPAAIDAPALAAAGFSVAAKACRRTLPPARAPPVIETFA